MMLLSSVLLGLVATNLCLAAPQQVEPAATTNGNPINAKSSGCGLYGPHDVDGEKKIDFANDVAQYGELPWTVMLLKKKWIEAKNSFELKNVHTCHGALINHKAVLVSVHCVYGIKPDQLTVRVGEWDTKESSSETHPIQERTVSEIIYHSPTDPWSLENMVAIIILSSPIEFGKNVNPVCLPRTNDEYDASQCIVSGWSETVDAPAPATDSARLKRVKLPVITHDACQNSYSEFASALGYTITISPSIVCAGTKDTPDMCKGETGRPLICPLKNDPTRYVLVGLGVFDYGCSVNNRLPSQFVKVLPDRTWIDEKISEKQLETSAYTY